MAVKTNGASAYERELALILQDIDDKQARALVFDRSVEQAAYVKRLVDVGLSKGRAAKTWAIVSKIPADKLAVAKNRLKQMIEADRLKKATLH